MFFYSRVMYKNLGALTVNCDLLCKDGPNKYLTEFNSRITSLFSLSPNKLLKCHYLHNIPFKSTLTLTIKQVPYFLSCLSKMKVISCNCCGSVLSMVQFFSSSVTTTVHIKAKIKELQYRWQSRKL